MNKNQKSKNELPLKRIHWCYLEILIPRNLWRYRNRHYIVTEKELQNLPAYQYKHAVEEIGIGRSMFYKMKEQNHDPDKLDYLAVIPSEKTLYTIPKLNFVSIGRKHYLSKKDANAVSKFKKSFPHSHKMVFLYLICDIADINDINSSIDIFSPSDVKNICKGTSSKYMTVKAWLERNIEPLILGQSKKRTDYKKYQLETLIDRKLWRFDATYLVTAQFYPTLKQFTEQQVVKANISFHTFTNWKKTIFKEKGEHTKKTVTHSSKRNPKGNRNLLIISNSAFIDQIPTISPTEYLQNNQRYYMKRAAWDRIENFLASDKIANHYVFAKIVGKRSGIDPNNLDNWFKYGRKPRITPDIDYNLVFAQISKTVNIQTRLMVALFGQLLVVGGFEMNKGTKPKPGLEQEYYSKKPLNYIWRSSIKNAVILFWAELIPTAKFEGGWVMSSGYSISREHMNINSVDPFFIRFLEKHSLIEWNGVIGKFNMDVTVIKQFHPDNLRIFIANMISPLLRVDYNSPSGNLYLKLRIPSYNRSLHQIRMFFEILRMGGILPSLIEISAESRTERITKIINLCSDFHLNYTLKLDREVQLSIASFYGPRGSKMFPDYDFQKHTETLQRIIEDYIPLAHLSKDQVEKIEDLAIFYNTKYGEKMNRYPEKQFKECLESIGYLLHHSLTVMLENVESMEIEYKADEKTQRENIEFCIPEWHRKEKEKNQNYSEKRGKKNC